MAAPVNPDCEVYYSQRNGGRRVELVATHDHHLMLVAGDTGGSLALVPLDAGDIQGLIQALQKRWDDL